LFPAATFRLKPAEGGPAERGKKFPAAGILLALSGGRGGLAASSDIQKCFHFKEFDQRAARLGRVALCFRREFDSTLAGNFFKPAGDFFEPAGNASKSGFCK